MISFSARMKEFAAWLKANPIVTILGIVGSAIGVIKGLPAAWDAATQTINVPKCLTYASKYYYPTGHFVKEGGKWTEYGDAKFEFTETHRDRNIILLLNKTPRRGRSDLILTIPVCGGTARWTFQNPENWQDLYEVWR